MGMHNDPKEKISKALVGWKILGFGYIEAGFFLELEKGTEKKRLEFVASDLGIGIAGVVDLNTNILMVSNTYELIYERMFDAAEKNPVTLFRNDDFVGFESDGLKVLMRKEDLQIDMRLFGSWAPEASVLMWGDEDLFQKMIYHWLEGGEIEDEDYKFLDKDLDPEEHEIFIKTKLGEEAWERLKDVERK